MIRPSPEIAALAERFMQAIGQRRDPATLINMLAGDASVTYVGSGPDEVWTAQMLRRGYGDYVTAAPELSFREVEVSGWEAGETGWALWTGLWRFAGADRDVPMRSTMVFAMDRGFWRIVQVHNSVPVANAQVINADDTRLADLVAAARDEDAMPSGLTGSATIMFTDVAGSAALAAALGDTRWSAVIGAHLDATRAAIEAGGGTLVKSLGDGTMSTFPSTGAALAVAQRLQRDAADAPTEPRLQLRIGLHTGDVVAAGGDFFGTVVNQAARIAALAAPGEIRVSEAVRLMVGGAGDIAFRDPIRVGLKGLDGDHLIHRLDWQG